MSGPPADTFEKFLDPFARSFALSFDEFGRLLRIIGLVRLFPRKKVEIHWKDFAILGECLGCS